MLRLATKIVSAHVSHNSVATLDGIEAYIDLLENKGHHVIAAASGRQCVTTARKELPDLILLDIEMPKQDGLKTLSALKGKKETKDLKVVMLTSLCDDPNITDRAKKLGAEDCISLSTTFDDFYNRIRPHFKSGRPTAE